MEISERFQRLPEPQGDPWIIYNRARALQDAGIPVVKLSIGDHDLPTPDLVLDRLYESATAGNTGYGALAGTPALREAIAERATRVTKSAITPEHVAVVPGGQFALSSAVMAVLNPGDTCLVVDPFYATYPLAIRAALGVMKTVPAPSDQGFQPDLAALEQAAPRARALIINSPNNPTGAVYSRETLEGIAAIAKAHDLWVISDDVYDTQVWEGEHLSIRALPGMAERTMIIGSLSKSHRMTGSRFGWLIGPEQVMAGMKEYLLATTFGLAPFLQDAALAALRDGDQIAAETRATYARRREKCVEVLQGSKSLRVSPPQGSMYLMLDIRATGLTGIELAVQLLEQHHIAVMPGEGFGPSATGHVRVAMTVADDALVEALKTLRRFAEGL